MRQRQSMTALPEPAASSRDSSNEDRGHLLCVEQSTLRLFLSLALLFSACAPQRMLMKPSPPHVSTAAPRATDLQHIELDLCDLQLENLGRKDENVTPQKVRQTMMGFLKKRGRYAALLGCSGRNRPIPQELLRVRAKTTITPEHDTHRSWIFDVATAPLAGMFTPRWGRATVTIKVEFISSPKPIEPIEVKVSAPYSVLFYAWYRTAPIALAYQRVHTAVFEQLAERLATHLDNALPPTPIVAQYKAPAKARPRDKGAKIIQIAGRSSPNLRPQNGGKADPDGKAQTNGKADPDPIELLAGTEYYTAALELMGAQEQKLSGEGFRLIAEPVIKPESDSLLSRYLQTIGGVEASVTGGLATVSSKARTERRGEETVGSGRATTRGYRFSVYRPPDETGFFFPIRLGFFSQDITISGFREALPQFSLPGTQDIPALPSNPNSGLPVDIDEPVSYFLKMKSGYLGHGAGFNLVLGTDAIQFFGTVALGLNFFEVRHSDVEINQAREKGWSFGFFESGQLYAQLGFEVPSWNIALRTAMEFEWFRSFDYPNPIEFRAGVAFNEDKQIFERERVFVSGASLTTFNWQVSAVYLF